MNPQQPHSLPPDYFDAVYQASADPWQFETSPYEQAKYHATLAALPRPAYGRVLELGCSIGVLTEQLALRCQELLALDVAEAALAQARRRCAHLPQVRFERRQLPQEFPAGQFELIVVSEVGYYWDAPTLQQAVAAMLAALPAGGQLLLVHWTPFVHDYPLTGDEVHDLVLTYAQPGGPLRHLLGQRQPTYRLDLLEKMAE